MSHLTLVLPFALPPAEHARDLIAQLRAPVMARLLSHAAPGQRKISPAFDACLPHERWLAGHTQDTSPALGRALMQALGLGTQAGCWFIAQPVHLHVARDHLVLTDYRQLILTDAESRALFAAAEPVFAEQGQQLVYGNARFWFLRADHWAGLRTSTPDAACGHNIDVWQPGGDMARAWRRMQNEVQMLWHQHAVNEARDRDGQSRVNGLWLWGGSGGSEGPDCSEGARLLAAQLAQPDTDRCREPASGGIRLSDALVPFALADDWSDWLRHMAALDEECLAPSLKQLSEGNIDRITLVLSDSSRLHAWTVTRASMRKFWVTSSLSRLLS